MESCKFSINISKEGYTFIFFLACLAFILSYFSFSMSMVCLMITLFFVCSFRDPERIVPKNQSLILSPADGKILNISESVPPEYLEMENKGTRFVISITPSLNDVYVNRIPIAGKVRSLYYKPGNSSATGGIFSSCISGENYTNNQQVTVLETWNNQDLILKQIAGTMFRRIICDLHEGRRVHAGERFGMMRFGSKVEIFLPEGILPKVAKGQIVIAGETVLAEMTNNDAES